jgi:hypothetical protein
VPLDDALRAAARHHRAHPGDHVSVDVAAGHRPREVQALIRAGLSAQEVAERCGWPVEKVHKYEVPILAEREYVAGLAKLVRLRSRGAASASPTLAGRVAGRLEARGVDADDVSWDAWRLAGAEWTVVLSFPAGGRQRQATWGFDPSTHAVHPRDDEARWFSEDDPASAADLVPREVPVYDVEAEGGVGEPRDTGSTRRATGVSASARRREGETVDLMAAMRERSAQRRGRRRPRAAEVPGLEDVPEEALPLEELARDPREELPPPAHTHPEDDPDVEKHGDAADRIGAEAAARKARRAERTQPVRQAAATAATVEPTEPGAAQVEPAEGVEPVESGESVQPAAARVDAGDSDGLDELAEIDGRDELAEIDGRDDAVDDVDDVDDGASGELIEERATASDPRPAPPPRPAPARKSGRPSVPSWDDIMFGRRGD